MSCCLKIGTSRDISLLEIFTIQIKPKTYKYKNDKWTPCF